MSRRIALEASKEALAELFDPATSQDLNVPLSEHLLRMLAYEHLSRGGERTESVLEALTGPKECHHGRPRESTCPECVTEAGDEDEEESPHAAHRRTWNVLRAFCAAYRAGQPFSREALYKALTAQGYNRRTLDPDHDQEMPCARIVVDHNGVSGPCGHPYHRHFDGYEDNEEVGCKYCSCRTFVEPEVAKCDPAPEEP